MSINSYFGSKTRSNYVPHLAELMLEFSKEKLFHLKGIAVLT
ncbi:hypothetical protein SLEP1_g2430 [Rubroshorea leprosula]|uniref:Uncharacterized protein n=1 Tax=Rubroshorea leprosula TaxID=152421 RepID=A0AAV5HQH8_9ROSI|nr:hypothetical protein SLEP1_g2430 [Rubroshorea leprosula]